MEKERNEKQRIRITSDMELTAMYAMLAGLVVLPAVLRALVLKEQFGEYAYINFPYIIGVGILLAVKGYNRAYSRRDGFMLLIWTFCTALMFYANYEQLPGKSWTCFFNLLFPVVLFIYHFEEGTFLRFMKHFLIVFDVLMILYFILELEEYFNSHAFLTAVYSVFPAGVLNSYLEKIQVLNRFFSVWGHALYNAVYFNAFFIINDVYFHCRRKRYPKVLFFLIAFVGCCLCAAKTAIVVVLVYMLISCIIDRKYNKWILPGAAIGILAVYASGAMDSILLRFVVIMQDTPDRISDFMRYFHTGIYPLRWLKGYGARFVWNNMNDLRSGFEFPLMTDALHFGIVFSVLLLIGLYVYVSVHMLHRRRYLCWAGFTAMYIQINCFDGIARDTQDVFSWVCLLGMVMLNCAIAVPEEETPQTCQTEVPVPEEPAQTDAPAEQDADGRNRIIRKLSGIWDYYKLLILLGIFTVAAGIYLAYTIANPGTESICTVMLADVKAYGTDDDVFAEYPEENGYEAGEYKINLIFADTDDDTAQLLAEKVLTEDVDLIIAHKDVIENLNKCGALACLDDIMGLDELLGYETDLYTSQDEEGNGHVYAIELPEGNEVIYDGYYSGDVWIAIAVHSQKEQAALDVMEYLMIVQDHTIPGLDSSELMEYLEEMNDEIQQE